MPSHALRCRGQSAVETDAALPAKGFAAVHRLVLADYCECFRLPMLWYIQTARLDSNCSVMLKAQPCLAALVIPSDFQKAW